jgi:protein-disulfide isomerase
MTSMTTIFRLIRNHWLDGLTVVILAVAAYLASAPVRERWARSRADRASIAMVRAEWAHLKSETLPLYNDSAEIQVVEISDYECPYCRRSAAAVDSAVASGVHVSYLNYPLSIHPHAEGAAIAALCAESAGKFRAMHARLMGTIAWQSDTNWVREAMAAGINDTLGFVRCIHGKDVKSRLARGRTLADRFGMQGTPMFVSKDALRRGASSTADLLALDHH